MRNYDKKIKNKLIIGLLFVVLLLAFHASLTKTIAIEKDKEPIMQTNGWNPPEIISSQTDQMNSSNYQLFRDDLSRVHALWLSKNNSFYTIEWRIFSNGTWSATKSIMNGTISMEQLPDYQTAFDSQRRFHFVWRNSSGIFHKYLDNNLQGTWSEEYSISDDSNEYAITADNRGRLYCVYFALDEQAETENIFSRYFNGDEWSTPTRISNRLYDPDNPVAYYPVRLAIDSDKNNKIFFLYTANYWDFDDDIQEKQLRYCFYDGLMWSGDIKIAASVDLFDIDVAFDGVGQAHIFYSDDTIVNGLIHKVYGNKAWVFTETVILFEKVELPTTEDFYFDIIAFDVVISGSDIYLSYSCMEWIYNVGFDYDLLLAHYRGGWTTVALSSTNATNYFRPNAAIDPLGHVYITSDFTNQSSYYLEEIMFFFGEDLFNYAPTTPYKTSLLFGPVIIVLPIIYYFYNRKKNIRS